MNKNIQILKAATALLVAGFITELPGIRKTKQNTVRNAFISIHCFTSNCVIIG